MTSDARLAQDWKPMPPENSASVSLFPLYPRHRAQRLTQKEAGS